MNEIKKTEQTKSTEHNSKNQNPSVGVQPDVRCQSANPWSIDRTHGKPETTLTFYTPDGKEVCEIKMDEANSYLLGAHFIYLQDYHDTAIKENVTVSPCR